MIKMSDEQKSKAGSYVTLIYRAFIGIGMAVLLKTVPVFVYDVVEWKNYIEDRTLSSVEMRIDLERHMEIWTLEAQSSAFGRLANTERAIIALKKADSLSIIDRREMRMLLAKIEHNTRK